MNQEILIILFLILAGFVILGYLFRKWIREYSERQRPSDELVEWLKSTNSRLDSSSKALNERLDKAAQVIGAVQKNIGEMSEIGRGMKELQEFLRSPKLRGNIGEQILKELLGQMLPKQTFQLQYRFKSGVIVDAAIKTTNGIIPIDSKFPLENFRKIISAQTDTDRKVGHHDFEKDVKIHIQDISKKYILTEEGTIDYALMYIPSEAIYYEIVNNPALFDFSTSQRVLPVSPMTLYAYLRAILMSFEGQKIETQAKEILRTIRSMQKDYQKVEENMNVLQRHITNAYNQMNNVSTSFTHLGQKFPSSSLIDQEKKIEINQLEMNET
jgi:DNA recombination protein RmuC